MTKKNLKNIVKECVDEMMDVGQPKPMKKGSGGGIEKTIKTTNQVIDALASGRINADTAKKLIAKIAAKDISDASNAAAGGCRY